MMTPYDFGMSDLVQTGTLNLGDIFFQIKQGKCNMDIMKITTVPNIYVNVFSAQLQGCDGVRRHFLGFVFMPGLVFFFQVTL
jgi:hypothetical protein